MFLISEVALYNLLLVLEISESGVGLRGQGVGFRGVGVWSDRPERQNPPSTYPSPFPSDKLPPRRDHQSRGGFSPVPRRACANPDAPHTRGWFEWLVVSRRKTRVGP